MTQHMDTCQDRVAGLLVGLAAGDENGGPTEMALRLAQSLLSCGRYDPDDVFERYLEWHRQGSYDTGTVAGQVFDLAVAGLPAEAAARQVDLGLGGMTAGCNPAHRASVLAMASWLSTDELVKAATRETGLTHHHPIAADAAVAMTLVCHDHIMGRDWREGDTHRIAATLHGEVAAALNAARVDHAPPPAGIAESTAHLHRGGYSPGTLRAGLYFAQGATNPADALAAAKRFAGPANYCPVLTGALLGAAFGAGALDDALLKHHPPRHIAEIKAAAWGLARTWRQ
jgi:ADP-ribosylglycohydrolase